MEKKGWGKDREEEVNEERKEEFKERRKEGGVMMEVVRLSVEGGGYGASGGLAKDRGWTGYMGDAERPVIESREAGDESAGRSETESRGRVTGAPGDGRSTAASPMTEQQSADGEGRARRRGSSN